MKKKQIIVLLVSLVVVLLTACGLKEPKQEPKEHVSKEQIKIGFALDSLVLERWTRDRDVFVSTAEKLGASVDVRSANGDVATQKKQIEKFIQENVDVIVIVAVDCHALKESVEKARSEGIFVISYDRLIQGTETDLYLTVDNEMVGSEMAKMIKECLPKGGNVVMLCGPKSDTNATDVVRGFEKEIEGGTLHVMRKEYVESWAPENGVATAGKLLANTDNIDAIMCGNDNLAGYAIRALSEKQLAGKVIVVGQDADLEACQRIVEGTQKMTCYKPIDRLAKVAAECAVSMAKDDFENDGYAEKTTVKRTDEGIKVPYWSLPPTAVTAENMDEVIIDLGFHLKEEVYLNVQQK